MDTLPINLISLALAFSVNTKAATGIGEWHFGPDVSENFACQKEIGRAHV